MSQVRDGIVMSPTVEMALELLDAQVMEYIGDGVARTIASYYHSPSPRDENITLLSHGMVFNKEALIGEIDYYLSTPEFNGERDLLALKDWAERL